MSDDLNKIKKKYGEKFAHLCRELFPTILETNGLLYRLIESKFYPNKLLYDDIINNKLVSLFQNFINNLVEKEDDIEINVNKTPYELLDEAGYILYECKNEDDIQKFKKYYKKGEELCTFKGNRLETNYVFFAVKKNVDDIKREDFTNPERQNEYGTSVISIQFTREKSNYVSIKNRYNHTVANPDSTFGNNLDNIITGLTKSFEDTYEFNIYHKRKEKFEIPNYVLANDGRYYKYNYEINNIYYCTDNIIIDNFQVKKYEKDRYIIFDYFILDMKEKRMNLYNEQIKESFPSYNININNIEIRKEKDKKYILLEKENHQIVIVLDNENRMISYYNDLIFHIDDNFLQNNKYLKSIYMDNVTSINHYFMERNIDLKYIHIPLLEKAGDYFLYSNRGLEEFSFPNLECVGKKFIYSNVKINKVNLASLKIIGDDFMRQNRNISYLELPFVIQIGDGFISRNQIISSFYAPCLEEVGNDFLTYNDHLRNLELPCLKRFEYSFLQYNKHLEKLKLPNLEKIEKYYLAENMVLNMLEIPEIISNKFIYNSSFKNNFRHSEKKLVLTKS